MNILFRTTILVILVMGTTNAHAFVQIVGLVPANPQANEDVFLVVQEGVCDDVFAGGMDIAQQGDFILVTIEGVRSFGICGNPVSDTTFAIGRFAPGSYTLQLNFHYNADFPSDSGTETMGTIQFEVAPSSGGVATAVPSLNMAGKIGLLVVLALICFAALRRRWYRK